MCFVTQSVAGGVGRGSLRVGAFVVVVAMTGGGCVGKDRQGTVLGCSK